MTYEQALSWIHGSLHLGSKLELKRMKQLLVLLGDPQKQLKAVHIAGSNGKGSTAAMCASVLQEAGLKTGLFISPFVMDFRERMQVNGEMIPKEQLAETLELMIPHLDRMKAEDMECTEFEILTALAFCWFQKMECDIVVLEVGLGGRLDATNAIDAPEVCAITALSLEHTNILGDTIEKIACEKAGIIKHGASVAVYCDLLPEALKVVTEKCKLEGVVPHVADLSALNVLSCEAHGSRIRYQGKEYFISLTGRHQIYNALTVLTIITELRNRGWDISDKAVQDGLARTVFGGRFEEVIHTPLCLIDGAHNLAKVGAMCEAVDSFYNGKRHIFVMGILSDKDVGPCVRLVAERSDIFIASTPDTPRALPADQTAELAKIACADVRVCADPRQAAVLAYTLAEPNDVVLACGSLYMIGDCKRGFLDAAGK